MTEPTHERVVRCDTCGVDLGSGLYARNADHTEVGPCAIFGQAHLDAHPGHELSYRSETLAAAARRRDAEAQAAADTHRQTVAFEAERRQNRAVAVRAADYLKSRGLHARGT